jgi:hypothetical protein
MAEQLQIGADFNRAKASDRQQINQITTTTRLPNNLFVTITYMTPEAATFTYGFYHGNQQRLAPLLTYRPHLHAPKCLQCNQTSRIPHIICLYPPDPRHGHSHGGNCG